MSDTRYADSNRRLAFEALVCQALWLLILFACGKRPVRFAVDWRGNALSYFDQHGTQGEKAQEYRRDKAFPDLHP
jgi:hypothetical protein